MLCFEIQFLRPGTWYGGFHLPLHGPRYTRVYVYVCLQDWQLKPLVSWIQLRYEDSSQYESSFSPRGAEGTATCLVTFGVRCSQ